MRRHRLVLPAILSCILSAALPGAAAEPVLDAGPGDLLFGGCGGAYLLAEPGELVIEVLKRDRNRRNAHTELRAILAGPDRQVCDEASIPDSGTSRGRGEGPLQRARVSTHVARTGVYALNITVSQDRYGEEIVWGFRTNCPRYVIETSRGHRDEPHREPIVLAASGRPADVFFLPRPGSMTIDLAGVSQSAGDPEVFDARGASRGVLRTAGDGRASLTLPAKEKRDGTLWRLHLPAAHAVIEIDGVTRWERSDPYQDSCCWTPDARSWFPLLAYRWLVTPYHRTVYGAPGAAGEIRFQLHANTEREEPISCALEFPDGSWPARLDADLVTLPARRPVHVALHYTVPPAGEARTCHIRATPVNAPGFTTYATLRVVAGDAPASQPLSMPIVLRPYRHENAQFGYLPAYPLANQVYFDRENRPCVQTEAGIAVRRDGVWHTVDWAGAVTAPAPPLEGGAFRPVSTKIAFNRGNDLYLIASRGSTAALLRSGDGGTTFTATPIPGRTGAFDIEQFSGHNIPAEPPPFVRFTQTARDPKLIWRRLHDLELFLPRKTEQGIELGAPVLISGKCIGMSAHSGAPSSIVSRGAKVHIAWAEATDPAVKVPGVPTYAATFDRASGALGTPVLLGYGRPPNDVHNSPSITMDREGYLHVLIGTHGQPFQYVCSRVPNDAHGGWTDPVPAGEGLGQTYIGLVCGPDDTLHAVFRLWRTGPPFPHSSHATLAYQRKRPGKPWEPPRILIVAPFSEYSVFYHRLTIDRTGRLFLSYDYWSTYWFYRLDHYGRRRALLMSPDGGDTWRLAGDL